MHKRLSIKSLVHLSFLLFGFFFGAGNLIFPPLMGKMAGSQLPLAMLGFAITSVICPILGIIAISKMGGVKNLTSIVSPRFAMIFQITLYLAIGPGLGIPRAGSMPFAMAIKPILSNESTTTISRFVYTIVFFIVAYWLCISPKKMVERVGKYLTPILLVLMIILFISTITSIPFTAAAPEATFANAPLLNGILAGYNTLDALAALNFGFAITLAVHNLKLKDEEEKKSLINISAVLAGSLLFIIYCMLSFVGMTTTNIVNNPNNGADIIRLTAQSTMGIFGYIIMVSIFTLACLTTCIGLIMSISEYFSGISKKYTYKQMVLLITTISCIFANFGLDTIISFSLPILLIISPVSVVLIFLGFGAKFLQDDPKIFKITIYVCLAFSCIDVLKSYDLIPATMLEALKYLPLSNYSLSWILPTIIVFMVFLVINKAKKTRRLQQEV